MRNFTIHLMKDGGCVHLDGKPTGVEWDNTVIGMDMLSQADVVVEQTKNIVGQLDEKYTLTVDEKRALHRMMLMVV